ncbi:uncharacterized protein LOC8284764 isoform X1 [Ricinus communis]|uniref:uncharacterized protein LOC8284764 isoform X1 n=1 Tax=Ricinus communis TaxID=3988 RepID=UPI00201B348F|nr:uncharacterized protein LOC8284764 isoform X1 [Ricinus communis]XP_048225663.1 uncharacterized protein LOC8284764 isoform X1 [Ricinus communis]
MDFMDWDLWSSPYDPVAEESRFFSQPERMRDFYFGYGFDAIEEDALNEKYCIQALRILITEADTEIDKLEQDLISLQSELAWIEDEEWSQICSNALREKINCLDISIKHLMNKDKNDVEVHLLMHTQPIETLNEILKDLLSNNLCKKREQPKEINDAIILISSDVPREALNVMRENKKGGSSYSIQTVREGMKESSSMTEDAAVHPSLKLQERKTNNPENVKPANASTKDSNPSLKVAAGHSGEEILSSNYGLKNAGKGESRKHGFSPKDKKTIQNLGSKSADKGRRSAEKIIEVPPTKVGVINAISDASKHADRNFSKKNLSNSDSSIENEMEEQSSISSADVSLGSSMKLEVKQADPGKKVKLANAIVKGLGLSASRHATGEFNEMKNLCRSSLEVSGNREHYYRAPGKSKTLTASLNCGGKGNYVAKHEHADFDKNVSTEELRCTNDVNGRKGFSDSGFGTSCNPDIKQKMSDFSQKAARKWTIKESKVSATEKAIPLNSSLKAEGKPRSPRRIVKVVEAALTETENCALTSLLEQPDKKGNNAIKVQSKEEGKTMREVHTSKIATEDKKSRLNLSLDLEKEKTNRSTKSNPLILQEIGISTMVVDSSSTFISKGKKRQKSLVSPVTPRLYQDCKAARKAVQPSEFESKKNVDSFDNSANSVSSPQNKRKKSTIFPIIAKGRDFSLQMDFSSSHRSTADSSTKDDLPVIESSSCDFGSEAAASLPSASVLEKMKLADLRKVAKQQKLTKCSKLSKKAILQQLADRTGDR